MMTPEEKEKIYENIPKFDPKSELVNNKTYKPANLTNKILIAFATLSLATSITLWSGPIYRYIASEKLPADSEDIYDFYIEHDVHTSYSQSDGLASRLAIIENKPVKFNVLIDVTDEEKAEMQKSIDEINEIFKVINPAYKFELNFSPSFFDKQDPYNVDISYMSKSDEVSKPNTLAYFDANEIVKSKNGYTPLNSEIRFRKGCITRRTFTHEIGHLLCVGDAYLEDEASEVPSIMHNNEPHIRKNDVALWAGKYGDYSTEEKEQKLVEYIENYEKNQDWYQEEFQTATSLVGQMKTILQETYPDNADEIFFNFEDQIYVKSASKYLYYYENEIAIIRKNTLNISSLFISDKIDNNSFNSKKTNKIYSVYMSTIDGVRYCRDKNIYLFMFGIGDSIYQGLYNTDKDKWSFVKAYDICSKDEYESLLSQQKLLRLKDDNDLTTMKLNEIKSTISNHKGGNLNFQDFISNTWTCKNNTISYDSETDCIILDRFSVKGNQKYCFTNGVILLDCNVVIYENKEGNIEFGSLLIDDKTQLIQLVNQQVLTAENNLETNDEIFN